MEMTTDEILNHATRFVFKTWYGEPLTIRKTKNGKWRIGKFEHEWMYSKFTRDFTFPYKMKSLESEEDKAAYAYAFFFDSFTEAYEEAVQYIGILG